MNEKDKTDPLALKKSLEKNGECAPDIEKVEDGVCSTAQNIAAIRKWLGENKLRDAGEVVEAAKKNTGCSSESCLYKKIPTLDKSQLDERFNPEGPWNSVKWLSNTDIDQVLEKYAEKFPRFKHMHFEMRDFVARGGDLARVDWADMAKKYDYLGCVLNTDLTGGSGEHWTAIFVDFKRGTVEYFDSAGVTPPHCEFTDFVVDTAHKLTEATGRQFRDVLVTKIVHQLDNTECGVYSLYYILSRLHGVKHEAFEYKRVPDDVMVDFRRFLFRNS